MIKIEDHRFPEHLLYDIENQVWYEPLPDGLVRAGFTSLSMEMIGEVLVYTPKRVGKDFETNKSFATIEGGKWIGSARAAFEGVVVEHNEELIRKPELLVEDAFGKGWMLIARPSTENWKDGLVTGDAIKPAIAAWLNSAAYRDRTG